MTAQTNQLPSKVLLVDDEENIVRSIGRLLMDEGGVEVITANSGARGLDVLRENPDVALILSDQRMPGMSGAEFLEQARGLAPDAVRMVLTGYADMASTMDAINKGGAWRYLTKPWDDEALHRAIMEGVDQYRLLMENRALHALVERQNLELAEWNRGLKGRVLEQTGTIRRQNEELKGRNQRLADSFQNMIRSFSSLIELHSSRLQEHTRNVTELSVRTARDLGLPEEEVEVIRNAALLHDIGVIGIATRILDKRMSAMTSEELEVFLQHAVRGQAAIDAVEELRGAGVLIRHHHERYEGGGFPDGLAGEAIPLGSRIIAFADFVDRELEERRGGAAVEAALARCSQALGRLLDPSLFGVIEPHIRDLYLPARGAEVEEAEKELRPKQLLKGMTVTRDLHNGSGLMIVEQGTELDSNDIELVLRHYRVDPPAGGIFVRWKPSGSGAAGGQPIDNVLVKERELTVAGVRPGMRLTRNLYSGTGLLLLTASTALDESSIEALERYYEIDPPAGGIFVSTAEGAP